MATGMPVSHPILVTKQSGRGFDVMAYQDKLEAAIQLLREHIRKVGGCDEVEALVAELIQEEREELFQ